jgi:hypothetical protein
MSVATLERGEGDERTLVLVDHKDGDPKHNWCFRHGGVVGSVEGVWRFPARRFGWTEADDTPYDPWHPRITCCDRVCEAYDAATSDVAYGYPEAELHALQRRNEVVRSVKRLVVELHTGERGRFRSVLHRSDNAEFHDRRKAYTAADVIEHGPEPNPRDRYTREVMIQSSSKLAGVGTLIAVECRWRSNMPPREGVPQGLLMGQHFTGRGVMVTMLLACRRAVDAETLPILPIEILELIWLCDAPVFDKPLLPRARLAKAATMEWPFRLVRPIRALPGTFLDSKYTRL